MAVDRDLAAFFVEEATKAFGFMTRENAFEGPTAEINDEIHFVYVTFMGRHVAVECILDEREEDIDCKVVLVVQGRKLSYYEFDPQGRRVRDGLYSLLTRRRTKGLHFRKVGGLTLRTQIPTTLGDFARMLREHGRDILADSPDVFSV
jgi:hypothetical protein